MKKSYETELPEGYSEAYTVDAKNGRTVIIMNLACLAITAAIIAIAWLIIKPKNYFENYDFLHSIIFIAAMLLYIVLHELTHGIAYKLTTGRKLTFGFTLSVAYCGVPDIYVYRKAAMTALLAPFSCLFPSFSFPHFSLQTRGISFIARCFSPCISADVQATCMTRYYIFFKFRSPDTLMRDTGPKQTFYTK